MWVTTRWPSPPTSFLACDLLICDAGKWGLHGRGTTLGQGRGTLLCGHEERLFRPHLARPEPPSPLPRESHPSSGFADLTFLLQVSLSLMGLSGSRPEGLRPEGFQEDPVHHLHGGASLSCRVRGPSRRREKIWMGSSFADEASVQLVSS